jgi:SAM-dependent methyltransferase
MKVNDHRYRMAQKAELDFWRNTEIDPRRPWWYYDRKFLPHLTRCGLAVEVGCGPVPYLLNHNVLFREGYAVDPLILKYAQMVKYHPHRAAACEKALHLITSTRSIVDDFADTTFCLNTLDHVQAPGEFIQELVRITNKRLFLYTDVDKPVDQAHPHNISTDWLETVLREHFFIELIEVGCSWKFKNDIFWFVGRRKE